MFNHRKLLVERLISDLPYLDLYKIEDKEARELFIDQLGTSISSGGRGMLLLYLMGIIMIPVPLISFPRSMIRVPMTVGLILFYENIYFFGADLMLRKNSYKILSQMKNMKDGSRLKTYAESLKI